jgi:hypothetical protein
MPIFPDLTMRKLILISLLPLAACANPALRNSPDYRAGYSDGCASASQQGANKRDTDLTRDDAAYQANQAYHSGWSTGFGACRQMAAPQSPVGDPLAMPKTP